MQRIYLNPITKEKATILKTSQETNGAYTLIEVELQPDGGNPIHYHKRFTEHFFPKQGPLGVHYKGQEIMLKPGEDFKVPILDRHRFYNPTDHTIIFQARLEPGQPGFERFMAVLFGLVRDGKTFSSNQIPFNPLYAALLLKWGDTQVDSFAFKILSPLINLAEVIAKWLGIDKKLEKRYVKE